MRRFGTWDNKEARADLVGVVLVLIALAALVAVVAVLFGIVPMLIVTGVLILVWIVISN